MNQVRNYSVRALVILSLLGPLAWAFANPGEASAEGGVCTVASPKEISSLISQKSKAALLDSCPNCTNIKVKAKFKIPKQAGDVATAPDQVFITSTDAPTENDLDGPYQIGLDGFRIVSAACTISNLPVTVTLTYTSETGKRRRSKTQGTLTLNGIAR